MISKTDNFWRKDAQRGEIIIYELLGRHPRIVSYPSHGYDPASFELLLQHHPWGDLNWYLQQLRKFPSKIASLGPLKLPKGSLTFIPKRLYGMTCTSVTCSSQMTCMLSSATLAALMSSQTLRISLKSAHLYHTYGPTAIMVRQSNVKTFLVLESSLSYLWFCAIYR